MDRQDHESRGNPSSPEIGREGTGTVKVLPSVYAYFDFRKFLLDFYNIKKGLNPRFSYRNFARLVQMNSSNYMAMIISGQRNLTLANAKKVANFCLKSPEEKKYFLALINWNQSRNLEEGELYWQQLLKSRPEKTEAELSTDQLRILTDWRAVALLELFRLKDFRPDPLWISKHFRFPYEVSEIANALKLLQEMGLVKISGNTGNVVNDTVVKGGDIPSQAIQMFHAQVARAGSDSLQAVPVELREFSATTVSVKLNDIQAIKEEIREFQKRLLARSAQAKHGDEVFQMNIQFFPLTKKTGSES